MGTRGRPGSRWARLPHAGLAGNRALCVFSLCKSCFIRDIDLCRPVLQPPAAPQTHIRAHDRSRKACTASNAAIGRQRSISRIKHDLHRENTQSARFPAKPACGSRAQGLPGRAHVPIIGRTGQTRLGTRLYRSGRGRCPEIWGVARARTMPSEQEESARDSSLWQRARIIM